MSDKGQKYMLIRIIVSIAVVIILYLLWEQPLYRSWFVLSASISLIVLREIDHIWGQKK